MRDPRLGLLPQGDGDRGSWRSGRPLVSDSRVENLNYVLIELLIITSKAKNRLKEDAMQDKPPFTQPYDTTVSLSSALPKFFSTGVQRLTSQRIPCLTISCRQSSHSAVRRPPATIFNLGDSSLPATQRIDGDCRRRH
jgi:hypothetical protein